MFCGVNHHLNSILFGVRFLSNEVKDSFIWLFQQFLDCMGNAPDTIITDQDQTMEATLPFVFSNTFKVKFKPSFTLYEFIGSLEVVLLSLRNKEVLIDHKDSYAPSNLFLLIFA